MGFLAPLIGGLLPGLISGLAGSANTRPPSLDPTQRGSLDSLIKGLMPTAQGTPTIDPIQQALMYGNIAASQTGANDAVTNALVSRGLGHSGLLGGALTQVANQAQQSRNQANLGLQQQAIQQKQLSIQDILGLLSVNNAPGQSGGAGFLNGMAPVLAYSIQSMMNNGGFGGGGSSGSVGSSPALMSYYGATQPGANNPLLQTTNSPITGTLQG